MENIMYENEKVGNENQCEQKKVMVFWRKERITDAIILIKGKEVEQ